MSKLPVVSGADVVRALEKVGFVVYRQRGSHITVVRKTPSAQTTIPNHKELDRGTLRANIRQAGLTVEEFGLESVPSASADGIRKFTYTSRVPLSNSLTRMVLTPALTRMVMSVENH